MTPWDWTWLAWLAGTLGSFAVLEYLGVRARNSGRPNGTLTSALRRWLGIDPRNWWRWVAGTVFGSFCLWLFAHILFGLWT